MTSEIETFRAELRAAGQPWSRRGIWSIGIGIVLMAVAQALGEAAPTASFFFALLTVAAVLMVGGWAMMVVAGVRRRRWARGHRLVMPDLSDFEQGTSVNP